MARTAGDHTPAAGEDGLWAELEAGVRGLVKNYATACREFAEAKSGWDKDTQKMLLSMLEVVDAFERLFQNIEPRLASAGGQAEIWVNNFRTVYKMLVRALKNAGVTPVEVIAGESVNPYCHNVVETTPDPGRADETVLEEMKRGYMWRGKLLRSSDVKAVKNT